MNQEKMVLHAVHQLSDVILSDYVISSKQLQSVSSPVMWDWRSANEMIKRYNAEPKSSQNLSRPACIPFSPRPP